MQEDIPVLLEDGNKAIRLVREMQGGYSKGAAKIIDLERPPMLEIAEWPIAFRKTSTSLSERRKNDY
jgi:hypothetical protein